MSDTEKPPPPTPSVDVADVLILMDAMAKHRVALVEMPGVKLALMPSERAAAPKTEQRVVPPSEAHRAVAMARTKLAEQREAMRRWPGAGSTTTGQLVKEIFEEAKAEVTAETRVAASSPPAPAIEPEADDD